jgi:hypothetical protein
MSLRDLAQAFLAESEHHPDEPGNQLSHAAKIDVGQPGTAGTDGTIGTVGTVGTTVQPGRFSDLYEAEADYARRLIVDARQDGLSLTVKDRRLVTGIGGDRQALVNHAWPACHARPSGAD